MNRWTTTIIIPCYKATATLERAVTSALQGAPEDLQLLLVEDGSPDDTGALCDRLAARDARITALHRPNGGAGAARNTGLDAATGDWVLFLDADDELLPGLWAALAATPVTDEGMVLFGLRRATAPYPKLFRRDRIGALRFDESLKINEDVLFNILFLQKTTAIYCLGGIYYKQNDLVAGSLSRSLRDDLLDAEAITRPALEALLRQNGLDPAPYLQTSRVRACLNQYGLLTGCRGHLSLARRRALFDRILADRDARAALRDQLRRDPNRLLAIPYRIGVACRLPGLLAAYTLAKQRFL